ncbi:polyribonucleotide nucleotidyltransferase [Humisphaera borealis]|uniref:Polyribonucleotide nucleotidyltransferase n=1 Tax=Humisphaera borealis TaxID=2807512 RepID=A0A7M2WUL5_9BACT|nr:polyribonucleotide nucleotidyltransferase [Humisphaera borealis]QOV88230.1 polyribonucleotide nucleotidyltransferase [Humisphaera borealis]
MQAIRVEKEIGGRKLIIETGSYAKLAHGAVSVQYGETVVFAAVVRAQPREGIDFFPMQVDYRERRAAAGKFPGGFLKREGRPTTKEILTARLIDRPLRPLFPKGFMDEVQVHLNVLAFDGENDPDVLAGIAASAAIAISDIPFIRPTAHVRVGRVDGKIVMFPTIEQTDASDFDIVVAGTKLAVNMIEVGAREAGEDEIADAIEEGHGIIKQIVGVIDDLVKKAGREKVGEPKHLDPGLLDAVRARVEDKLRKVKGIAGKQDRNDAVDEIKTALLAEMAPAVTDPNASYMSIIAQKDQAKKVRAAFSEIEEAVTREAILAGKRPDGRDYHTIRPISCEVGVLPRVHGSSVFTRGETQSMCTITLGTSSDEQMVDGLIPEYSQKFMLHYNFPSYSVGEVRPIRGPGRREIGHGALAERSLIPVLPTIEEFPYTVRVISDILESNGSSSMASSCAGTLALMDAGVPISKPVAGISIGLVKEGNKQVLLTDIIGEEDHFGDMDFKVCGTKDGITAIQLDIKIEGIGHDVVRDSLHRAKEARLVILDKMAQTLGKPRAKISEYAPRLLTIKIDPEKIGKIIGPGGKNIKALQADTGAQIDIEDDGTVYISSVDGAGAERCRDIIEAMTAEVKPGKIYAGRVVSIKDFGAFVEIAPETDGLCHVSELSDDYVERVTDVVNVGDEIRVKVVLIDDTGRIKLSRKQALREEGSTDGATGKPQPRGEGEDRGEGGGGGGGDRPPRRDDRGPRRDGGGDRGPRRDGGGGGGRGPRRD